LDLGRSERLFTGVQRSAVIARDRHCAWPECDQPARWCQIHHIRWWKRDFGSTSVDNGILLCTFHHHEVHRLDLSITRKPAPRPDRNGVPRPRGTLATVDYTFTDPTGRVIGRKPGAPPGAAPPPGATSPPGAPPDDLDFTRKTDPHTGMSVPAFMLE
ncbi:HNH endonuclease signature motif containing protein, partial [Pengzhenrongella sp.]|uniref:HNH endonuclease signature motif containing protein n=1 Tax=Pengzhenrongella sp. TaxID=2888820 RepID=UPI002F946E86